MIPTKKNSLSQNAPRADPLLPVKWLALRSIGILSLPIKNNLFATNECSDVRMNDPLECSRTNHSIKSLSNWTFMLSVTLPDGDVTDSCIFPEVARAANIRAIIPMKSWCYLLIIEHRSRTKEFWYGP